MSLLKTKVMKVEKESYPEHEIAAYPEPYPEQEIVAYRKRNNPEHDRIHRKRNNPAKFSSIADMRKQFNAFKILYNAGYDKAALEVVSIQFENSIEYATKEIRDMSEEMSFMRKE